MIPRTQVALFSDQTSGIINNTLTGLTILNRLRKKIAKDEKHLLKET